MAEIFIHTARVVLCVSSTSIQPPEARDVPTHNCQNLGDSEENPVVQIGKEQYKKTEELALRYDHESYLVLFLYIVQG